MNDEEIKNDIKEFNSLKKNINSLWKELSKDDSNQLLDGENKEEFIEALGSATNFVDSISYYYDDFENQQIYQLDCDFNDRENKNTKLVIRRKKKELDKIAKEVKELIENPILSNLFLEVTLRCNAKCEHCGSSCGGIIPKDEISAEQLKKTLLEIHEKYGAPNVFLTVTGGEPLMRKDLFDIMKYAVSLGFRWGMTTNGMLIDEEVIEKMRDTNFESISISLDGLKETHESFRKVPGSFKKIMKAIKLLQNLETLKSLQIFQI